MKNNILLRTNLLVCAVILLGFVVTSVINCRSNQGLYRKEVENVSALTSEGIYSRIESLFTRPVYVSLTMANDSLLKEFLSNEQAHLKDAAYIRVLREYLSAYREQYGFDSVFLVSARTGRYYHFNGLDRILVPGNPENEWYYAFLNSSEDYSLNIDHDKARHDEITIFINCRITARDGAPLGIVGVGFRIDTLRDVLESYAEQFRVRAWLVGEEGSVVVSTDQNPDRKSNLFATGAFPQLKERILENRDTARTFWHASGRDEDYIVTRYLPDPKWHLIVESDTAVLTRHLNRQFYHGTLVIAAVVCSVLLAITGVIRKYNSQIVTLTMAMEQKRRTIFQEATEQLYENIYELDITHNRAASEATARYFESLGAAPDVPYDQALQTIAARQVREEYRQGYVDTFSPANVLKAYREGRKKLSYDLLISSDGGRNYYWMRITAHIFYWEEDQSVRMFVYRQNIDAEKRRERLLCEQMQKDSLTGLYNKAATRERIRDLLAEHPGAGFAFFILDMDKFKQVNDTLGHAAGDSVLAEFARTLKTQFREEDVLGRIGGDEFVAFVRVSGPEAAEKKARSLVRALHREIATEGGTCVVTVSIGVALAPEAGREFETLYKKADNALYHVKENGRNGAVIYGREDPSAGKQPVDPVSPRGKNA